MQLMKCRLRTDGTSIRRYKSIDWCAQADCWEHHRLEGAVSHIYRYVEILSNHCKYILYSLVQNTCSMKQSRSMQKVRA